MRSVRLFAAVLLVTACQSCGGGTGSGGTAGSAMGGGGGTSGTAGAGGSAAGTGGSAGSGGSSAGTGGSATGGSVGGAIGGSIGGSIGGGAGAGAAGSGGASAGAGGATAGTGGSAAGAGGRGGAAGGAGGSAAGAGGRGGAAGGAGGATAGRGGATAGRGGATAGSGGATAGSGGRGGTSGATAGTGGGAGRGGSGGSTTADAGSDGPNTFNPCPTTAGTACIIMPLGDSITFGVGSSGSGGGYRVPLFQTTVTASELITFVGRNVNGPTTVAGRTFPRNHEGYSGYTIDPDTVDNRQGISPLVDTAISMFHPHIVLLMIGTNDVNLSYQLASAPTRLGALLDRITTDAPNALLVVARLTPTQDDTINGRVQTYNNAIPGVVQTRVAAGKHIVVVDMYAAFTANPMNYKTALMFDTLHPNDAGYMVMAQTWYAAIRNVLPGN